MNLSFVGVGKMGLPITRLLLGAGHDVCVFDTDAAQLSAAQAAGARAAVSLAECVGAAPLVFTSLPDDAVLRQVALGPQGLISLVNDQAIYVDTSTVSVALSAEIAYAAQVRSIAYLRMPVSGNAHSARTGQLTAIASGPSAAWERIKPVVSAFSVAQLYVGEAEQARVMKLAINLLVAGNAMLLAEALALGRAGGIQWDTLLDGVAASTLSSPWLRAKAAALKVRDFNPTFTPAQLSKDLGLMLDAGDQHQVPLPLTSVARQTMKAVGAAGWAEEDFIAVVKLLEQQSGLPTDAV